MRKKLNLFAMMSLVAVVVGCGEDKPVRNPEELNTEFKLAKVETVSEPGPDGLRMISLTFSDRGARELKMTAGSSFNHLEAGYYEISASADERLEAEVAFTADGEAVEITGGTVYVRKVNKAYDLRWKLQTPDGEINCIINDKELDFIYEEYKYFSEGGTGTVLMDQTITSAILGKDIKYTIYLPEGYDESRKYPILYILHGAWSHNNEWFTGAALNAYASDFADNGGVDMIIVSPHCIDDCFYCNGYVNGLNYMDFFFEEFVPHVETEYAVRAERSSRAIAGLSMGGYGTLYYGLLHPEMFCHMYACSSAISAAATAPDLTEMLAEISYRKEIQSLPGMTLEIGTEDFLFANNEAFVKILDSHNVAYEYITRPGAHTWPFWNACAPKIISKVAAAFTE